MEQLIDRSICFAAGLSRTIDGDDKKGGKVERRIKCGRIVAKLEQTWCSDSAFLVNFGKIAHHITLNGLCQRRAIHLFFFIVEVRWDEGCAGQESLKEDPQT